MNLNERERELVRILPEGYRLYHVINAGGDRYSIIEDALGREMLSACLETQSEAGMLDYFYEIIGMREATADMLPDWKPQDAQKTAAGAISNHAQYPYTPAAQNAKSAPQNTCNSQSSSAQEMYDALKEACHEMCVRCSGEELCNPCASLSEDGLHCNAEPGACFVQRWLNVLAKARGEDGNDAFKP